MASPENIPAFTPLQEKWSDLLFGVRKSVRYHNYRRQLFDRFDIISKFFIIICGGTVWKVSSSNDELAGRFGLFLAVLGTLDLVIGFSKKAREYHDLARRFSELEREMVLIGESYTDLLFAEMNNSRLTIEDDEPSTLHVLNAHCHNELVRALGKSEKERVRIYWFQKPLTHYYDVFPSLLIKYIDIEKALKNKEDREKLKPSPATPPVG